jgi:DNA replication and repair protein RecF
MIMNGEDECKIKIDIQKTEKDEEIEIILRRGSRKNIKINGIHQKRVSNLVGQLNTILFAPEDLMIIKEGPAQRRKYIDISISQLKPVYFSRIAEYAKIVQQKNALLKNAKQVADMGSFLDMMDVFNQRIAFLGAYIIKDRIEYINSLSKYADEVHHKLTKNSEELEIKYLVSLTTEGINFDIAAGQEGEEARSAGISEIEEALKRKLDANVRVEAKRGVSIIGPHRDDFVVMLGGKEIKNYGSQGQQRTAMIAAKLAEIDIVTELTEEKPVLILDDVMSELDESRRAFLLNALYNVQTIITCTDKSIYERNLGENGTYFNIDDAKII